MAKTQMSDSVRITSMILGVILVVAAVGLILYFRANPGLTASVQGSSTVKVMPDIVGTYFVIETKADTAAQASSLNNEAKQKMVDALEDIPGLGFEKKDLTTVSSSVGESCTWTKDGEKCEGYVAYHYLRLELEGDNMDFAGAVIDAGVNAGANLQYINFELSSETKNEYQAKALEAATKDAKSKAEGIASGLGKRVGRVVSLTTDANGGFYPYWRAYDAVATSSIAQVKEEATNIQPGEQEVYGSVSVVYALI